MKITWLGHSSFLLEESTGKKIVTDPYTVDFPDVSADAVTISHLHSDHNNYKGVGGNPAIFKELGAFEIPGIHISSALSSHGGERGDNLIFMFRIDGVDLCHLGDIGERCNIALTEVIGEVDVLMVPVGGTYTIDAETAKEYVDKLMPDIVIPMHYKSEAYSELDPVNDFLALFDEENIEYVDGDTIEVDRAQFDGEYTKVVVFNNN
ncbi:MAG: MBL fold metallo-hydrolase [Christensenellales bacterium]|jgi:L-ascorbate metabolism protein UlaG (beta-lactamase superfamily)